MTGLQLPNHILRNFDIPDAEYRLVENTDGLINKSFAVLNTQGLAVYFLQQIDHTIFKNIPGLMQNIATVCEYLGSQSKPIPHLRLVNTIEDSSYYLNADGTYWRLYHFEDGMTHFRADSIEIATEAGLAFGEFLQNLDSLDPGLLVETIPGFHDIRLRFTQFKEACDLATPDRYTKALPLLELVNQHIHAMINYYGLILKKCKLTITHNDTKLSNLRFAQNGKARMVIDYDTLMPGYLPFDFGDSVRTICSTTIEDDLNLEGTKYDLKLFEAFVGGFLNKTFKQDSAQETELLPMAACYMPFIMGLRMLTDYLNNDEYYSIKYSEHNLDRAANQFTLFMCGLDLQSEMNNIVKTAIKNHEQLFRD